MWGELLFPEHIKSTYESKISYVLNEFSNFRSRYNTVAKLNNLNLTMEQLNTIEEGIKCINIIKEYEKFKLNTDSLVNYISNVENSVIPESIAESIGSAKDKFFELRDNIKIDLDGEKAGRELQSILAPIKQKYIDYYFDKHTKSRLGPNDSKRKGKIINSNTLSNLKKLTEIKGIFQENKLRKLEQELSELQICFELTTADLQKNHICNKCKFTLSKDSPTVVGKLDYIEENLEKLLEEWTDTLLSALDDPLIMANKSLLNKEQQNLINKFTQKKQLPDNVDAFFTTTFNTLFEKLDKVDIDMWELMSVIQNLGPSTVEDLKNKLNSYIDKQVTGKDLNKVRLIITSKSEKKKDFLIAETNKDEEVTY